MSGTELTSRFVYIALGKGTFEGFLENIEESYLKTTDGKHVNEAVCVNPKDMPKVYLKLQSTFKTDKKVYPRYYIYEKNNRYTKQPIYEDIGEMIELKPEKEKEILLSIPKSIKSGDYVLKLNFTDDSGKVISELYEYGYTIIGESVSIDNITFDNDTHSIKSYIHGPKDGSVLNDVVVEINVYDENGTLLDQKRENIILENKLTTTEFYFNDYSKGRIRVEVKASDNGKILSFKSVELKTVFSGTKILFTDIDGRDCSDAVKTLNGLGIINGYVDNTFKPDNLITRGEFSTIVIKLLEMNVDESEEVLFQDTDNYWGRTYINTLYKKGYVSGYPNGTFGPQNNITYAEAITILINALGYKDEVSRSTIGWPDNYLEKAIGLGIIKDTDGKDWNANANRGDISNLTLNAYLVK